MRQSYYPPPIKMWSKALRWGMAPQKVLQAIEGWVSAHQ